jgi:hypothetical protein
MKHVLVELQLPKDWKRFHMPGALHNRLQALLDLQDETGKLSREQRREAQALTELSEMLSLMKLRAEQAIRRKS